MRELRELFEQHITWRGISKLANRLIEPVKGGLEDALEWYIVLTALEKAIGKAKYRIREQAIAESEKYGRSDSIRGVFASKREGRIVLDYSGDSLWVKLKEAEKEAKANLKQQEGQLKTAYFTPNHETGEIDERVSWVKRHDMYLTLQISDAPKKDTLPESDITFLVNQG